MKNEIVLDLSSALSDMFKCALQEMMMVDLIL